MLIALVNQSAHVKPADAVLIAAAITAQMQQEYATIWGKPSSTMVAVPDIAHIPANARPMFLLDKNPDPGALGDHEETASGVPVARIFVPDILGAPGAGMVSGSQGFSVSSVVSHEALEMDGNPYIDLWASGPDGYDHAREMCDAVESSGYQKHITVLGKTSSVLVSNFLTPRWFDCSPPSTAQFDYLGHLKSAFSIERNGYEIVKPTDNESQRYGTVTGKAFHFGAELPQWRLDFKKRSAGRGARMAAGRPQIQTHACNKECCAKSSSATSAVAQ